MEFPMYYDADYEAVLRFCDNPMIRVYDMPKVASEEHLRRKDYSLFGFWRTSNSENLRYFSAVAWYFARSLQEALQVPVGIIGCNWDGSKSACWVDRDTLERCGAVWLREYEQAFSDMEDPEKAKEDYFNSPMDASRPFDNEFRVRMMRGLPYEELVALFASFGDGGPFTPAIGPWHEWRPLGLYENMLKKVFPFTLRGVIFYQGESDWEHAELYADMLEGMIGCWRKGFRDAELPFLMTQLAPLGDVIGSGASAFPELREQQQRAADRISHVYLASISDAGHPFDIHPKHKRPVGERLALLARGHIYGEKVPCEAPYGVCMERQGDALVIRCVNAEGGLYVRGSSLNALLVEAPDGRALSEEEYAVSVEQDLIVITLSCPIENGAYRVCFAKTPYYEVNLYNMSGIPAKPFKLATA